MYTAKYHKNDDPAQIRDFIDKNSFGILVNQTNDKLWATHIPLEMDVDEAGNEILTGHIARANPQWKNFTDNSPVLAIFSGPHSYISSAWYDHENVPTWNYIAVHVYGTVRIVEGEKLLRSLKKLVDKYESSSPNPVSVEGMSKKFVESQIKGLVGFEIEINEIQATYKLSQNRDSINHQNITQELEKKGDFNSVEIAVEMKKFQKK